MAGNHVLLTILLFQFMCMCNADVTFPKQKRVIVTNDLGGGDLSLAMTCKSNKEGDFGLLTIRMSTIFDSPPKSTAIGSGPTYFTNSISSYKLERSRNAQKLHALFRGAY